MKEPQIWNIGRNRAFIYIVRRNNSILEFSASPEDVPMLESVRWGIDGKGRACTYQMGGKYISMHRVIMSPPEHMVVDHINGDFRDNRRSNLRICTHAENLRNRAVHRGSASKFKGVSIDKDKRKHPYRAKIGTLDGLINIGSFATELEAALAYDKMALKLHGEYAKTNHMLGLV